MKEEIYICPICGKVYTADEGECFDGTSMCSECFEHQTVLCRCCGERIWREDAVDYDLCQGCYEDEHVRCSDCGMVIHADDACYTDDDFVRDYPYCSDCYSQHNNAAIHEYCYKPEPIFYGSDKRYYGVELEMDEGGNDEDSAEYLLRIANRHGEHMYIKNDSSINDGFECVSHPMTLDYHLNHMPWEDVLQEAITLDYRSHQAETCGLHVHINRNGLGDTYEEQECTIAKILYFYEKFWNEIIRFSRRTERQINQWAKRYGGGLINPKETLKHAKSSYTGRYMAVNLENVNTIEMRIFRGTLKYSTFAATLQFVDQICDVAFCLSDEELQNLTWLDFVQRIPRDRKELIDYLKSRRLYVNEPVAAEAEV